MQKNDMLSQRHFSHHQIKRHLCQTLRKQHELSNRINVLLCEKEKKFKLLSRSIVKKSSQSPSHTKAANHKSSKIQQHLNKTTRQSEGNKKICELMRRQMDESINLKKESLRQTRNQWYKQMKQIEQNNRKKIRDNRQNQLLIKKKKNRQIKLQQINNQQNIKKYWDQRVQHIQATKVKDQNKNYKLFQDSLLNISILEQKEQQLKLQLKNSHINSYLRTENDNGDVLYEIEGNSLRRD